MIAQWIAAHAWAELWALAWHFGIIVSVIALCIAMQFFAVIPVRVRQIAVIVGICALVVLLTAGIYTRLGAQYVQAKWDAQAAAAVTDAREARASAEAQFPPAPPGARAGVLPNDPWDRDQTKPQGSAAPRVRAANPLLGVPGHSRNRATGARAKSNVR